MLDQRVHLFIFVQLCFADDHGNDFRTGDGCGIKSEIRTNGLSIYCSFSAAPLADYFDTGNNSCSFLVVFYYSYQLKT